MIARRSPMRRSRITKGRGNPVPLSVRAQVIARARNACERCGRVAPLDLHHRIKRSQGGQHTADNLVAVCGPCHLLIEDQPAQAVAEGFSVQLGKVAV